MANLIEGDVRERLSPHYTSADCRLSFPTPCSHPSPCGMPCALELGPERHALVELGALARLAIMAIPGRDGSFREQAEQLFAQLHCLAGRQPTPLIPTTMTVYLRQGGDEMACGEIVSKWFGEAAPVMTFVVQPPCSGAALAVELWAVGGPNVRTQRLGPQLLAVESDGIRWVHCGGMSADLNGKSEPYGESLSVFERMEQQLAVAGVSFDDVVRTWIYVNQITTGPENRQRYQELNRARTDFFSRHHLCLNNRAPWAPAMIYPASTGIGTSGREIIMSCLALESNRHDVFVTPMENPQQTSAYDYRAHYSPESPKFSRAMAVVQGSFVTTLVSGTASIVNSRTCHVGDIVRQTEQTIKNIERLIDRENFARHGMPGTGATLRDIAKLRVWVKRPQDYELCREVCERLLPRVPALYLQADVCRPDLLVEIEAVAFSPFGKPAMNGQMCRPGRKE